MASAAAAAAAGWEEIAVQEGLVRTLQPRGEELQGGRRLGAWELDEAFGGELESCGGAECTRSCWLFGVPCRWLLCLGELCHSLDARLCLVHGQHFEEL